MSALFILHHLYKLVADCVTGRSFWWGRRGSSLKTSTLDIIQTMYTNQGASNLHSLLLSGLKGCVVMYQVLCRPFHWRIDASLVIPAFLEQHEKGASCLMILATLDTYCT